MSSEIHFISSLNGENVNKCVWLSNIIRIILLEKKSHFGTCGILSYKKISSVFRKLFLCRKISWVHYAAYLNRTVEPTNRISAQCRVVIILTY